MANTDDNNHKKSEDQGSGSSNPSNGWLKHVPAIPAQELPRAPTTFSYDAGLRGISQERLRTSPSYNLFLLNHSAYAPPDARTSPSRSLSLNQAQSLYWQERLSQHDSQSSYPDPLLAQAPQQSPVQHVSGHQITEDPWTQAYSNLNRRSSDTSQASPPTSADLVIDPAIHALPPSHSLFRYQNEQSPGSSDCRIQSQGTSQPTVTIQYPVSSPTGVTLIEPIDNSPAATTSVPIPPTNYESITSAATHFFNGELTNNADLSMASSGVTKRHARADMSESEEQPSKRPRKGDKPRGRRKGEIRGPRTVVAPGEDFMRIYNRALDAFVEKQDFDTAQTLVLQAIGLNPEVFTAHSLLADIHFAKNNHEAGIDALMVGLHAHINDVDLWRQTADRILNVPDESYKKRVERAMYCYGAILRKDGKDADARFQRVECAKILRSYNRAFSDIDILMQDEPHNSSILAQFASLCRDVNDIPKAKQVYEEHFEYYKINGISETDSFAWQDISVYVDLLISLNETPKAISALRELARTLSGRQDEHFWDEYPTEDREFDQMHYPRRLELDQFNPLTHSDNSYGESLPLDLRGKLGILRLKSGQRDEAQSHFQWLEPDLEGEESLVQDYSDTFYEVARALFEAKEHEQALHFFQALSQEDELDLGADFWLNMAASAVVCAKIPEAISCYERAIELDANNIDARTELTKLYTTRRDREMAIKYGNEAVVLAQALCPPSVNRKYERKENRLVREAAENALKKAFRLPKGPGRAAGKVPAALLYRTRTRRRQFMRYIPEEYATPSPSPEPDPELELGPEERGREQEQEQVQENSVEVEQAVTPEPSTARKAAKKSKRKPREPKVKPTKVKPTKARKPRDNDMYKHHEDMQQLYKTLLTHQDAMREGEEVATNIWIDCAATLIDDFRTNKALYPSDRFSGFTGYSSQHQNPRAATPDPNIAGNDAEIAAYDYRRLAPVGLPDEYCGIRFQAWLDIFLELAMLYATSALTSDSQKECYKIITGAIECTVFYNDIRSLTTIYTCYMSCAMSLGDDLTLYNVAIRWFMREYAFCSDTYRLFQAITLVNELNPGSGGKSGQLDKAIFRSGPNQKFAFRQVMSIDQMLPTDYNKDGEEGGVPEFMRKPREELRKIAKLARTEKNRNSSTNDGTPAAANTIPTRITTSSEKDVLEMARLYSPKEMDVVLFVLYAQIMMANNSFTNALSYLYRAYSLDPKNCVCLLSMAFCYLHELFKRQTSNRHSYALMGWAWFSKYEDARLEWARSVDGQHRDELIGIVVQETEYNKARCWEMLGMADLSMRGYERVLRSSFSKDDSKDDLTPEAAYAMSVQYALNGNGQKARELTEKYLTI